VISAKPFGNLLTLLMPGKPLVAHQELDDFIAAEPQRRAEAEMGQPPNDEILDVALRAAVVCRRFLERHDFGQLFKCVHAHAAVSKCGLPLHFGMISNHAFAASGATSSR